MKPRTIVFVVCAVFSLTACTKGNLATKERQGAEWNSGEQQFAEILSVALRNDELSSFIIDEASKAFDGDNNFLVAPNSDNPSTKSGISFRDMLKIAFPVTRSGESVDIDCLLDDIKNNSPLLQIYVMNPECYENTQCPKVVYIPEDFEEGITMSLPCYDENGDKTMIPATEELENETVFVVSRNERTVAVDKVLLNGNDEYKGAKPIYVDEKFNYYLIEDLNISNPSKPTTGILDGIFVPEEYRECERYKLDNGRDYLYNVRPKDKSAWDKMENPFLGDPELYVDVIYGKYLGGLLGEESIRKELPTGYKNRNNIQWKTHDIELLQWDLLENGKSMKYVWNERDAGNIISISIPFSVEFLDNNVFNGNLEINVGKHDESCGEAIVYYTDENNHQYDTGYVLYTVQFR